MIPRSASIAVCLALLGCDPGPQPADGERPASAATVEPKTDRSERRADVVRGEARGGRRCLDLDEARRAVVRLTNELRASGECGGRPPSRGLSRSDQLDRIAQEHAEDMSRRGFFSHVDPDGLGPQERATAAGIGSVVGENIAYGVSEPEEAVATWRRSASHCAGMASSAWRTMGVGYSCGSRILWVQVFSR